MTGQGVVNFECMRTFHFDPQSMRVFSQLYTNVLFSSNAWTSTQHFTVPFRNGFANKHYLVIILGPKIITCSSAYMAARIVPLSTYVRMYEKH